MAKLILSIFIALVILSMPLIVLASDISDALWHGNIQITNSKNETQTAVVATAANISSQALIDNAFASDNLADVVIQYNGSDVPFMPGIGSNPWCIFVDSIQGNVNSSYDLYTGGVTGSEIVYFPGNSGMSISDAESMEPGSGNWTIIYDGYIDTSQVGANITAKTESLRTYISGTGNITSEIAGRQLQTTAESSSPLYNGDYTRSGQRLNDFPDTEITAIKFKLQKNNSPTGTGYVRVRKVSDDSIIGTLSSVDVSTISTSATWYTYTGSVNTTATQDIRVLFEYAGGDASNKVSIFYNSSNVSSGYFTRYAGSWTDESGDCGFEILYTSQASVVATGISSDNYTLTVSDNTTYMSISIDGVEKASSNVTGMSVLDNSNNWIIGSVATPYINNYKHYKEATLVSDISWQYNTTFTDNSGNGNNATPSFRTTSSDNMSASLINYNPTSQSQISTFSLTSSYSIITGNATAPGTMYTDLDFTYLPADPINEVLDEGGIPRAAWWFPFIIIGIGIIGTLVYGGTTMARSLSGSLAEGQIDGSLLLMAAVIEVLLVIVGKMGPIPLWPAYLFPLPALAIIMSKKHYAWG